MTLLAAEYWFLFVVTFGLQLVGIFARHIFVSLFFSFLHSIFISLILLAMGLNWVAFIHLWLCSAVSYFSLIQTSLLLGPQKAKKHKRRITFSLFVFISIVMGLFYLATQLIPSDSNYSSFQLASLDETVFNLLSTRYGTVVLTLALSALSALISVYLLVRRDDAMIRKDVS
jgi:hypothetical protein